MEAQKNVPELDPTVAALCEIAEKLASAANQIYYRARLYHDGVSNFTLGELQELQRGIEKFPMENPCTRAALAWESYLAEGIITMRRDKYIQPSVEAFWNESQRLQREFDLAVEATSK